MTSLSARQTLRFLIKNGLLVVALFFCLFPLYKYYQFQKFWLQISARQAELQSVADSLQAATGRLYLFPERQRHILPGFHRLSSKFYNLTGDSSLIRLNREFLQLMESEQRSLAFTVWNQKIEPMLSRIQLQLQAQHRQKLLSLISREGSRLLFGMSIAGLLFLITSINLFRTKANKKTVVPAAAQTDENAPLISFDQAILSRFTHDMKSPLGSIRQANLLLEKSLGSAVSPEQQRFLDIIRANQKKLSDQVQKILSAAQSETEMLKPNLKETNLVKLLTELLIFMSPAFREKQIRVVIGFAVKEVMLRLDEEKIREVFENLLSNAIKFSRQNSEITVNLKVTADAALVSIQDQGIGIPENEQEQIFSKLYRASNAREISVKGSGLGLFIVRGIVRAHQGSVEVRSIPGQGSTFTVHLPLNLK